jgi:hypothetical protein
MLSYQHIFIFDLGGKGGGGDIETVEAYGTAEWYYRALEPIQILRSAAFTSHQSGLDLFPWKAIFSDQTA